MSLVRSLRTARSSSDARASIAPLWGAATLVTLLGLLFAPSVADGHGLDEGQMILRLAGDTLYVTATPNQRIFRGLDQNRDGTLDRGELEQKRREMLSLFLDGFEVRDEKSALGEVIFEDLSLPHGHTPVESSRRPQHLRVTLRFRWKTSPAKIRLRYRLARKAPLTVRAQRATAARALTAQRPVGPISVARLDETTDALVLFDTSEAPARRRRSPRITPSKPHTDLPRGPAKALIQ